MDASKENISQLQPRSALSLTPVTEGVTFPPWPNDITSNNEQSQNRKIKQPNEQKSTSWRETQNKKRTRIPMDKGKKIYSVNGQEQDEGFLELEELYGKAAARAINTVGDFVADVAEGTYTLANDDEEKGTETRTMYSTDSDKRRQRYWRDRLTEQVDNAFGLYDDEKSYIDWEESDIEIENRRKSNDPISIFNGKGKNRPNARNRIPFWEEDGSLTSLLFGRTSQGQKIGSFKVILKWLRKNVFGITWSHPV